ncbi:MAG: DUF2867 domain-containing protein [Anaerolineales bacterium]
MAIVLVLPSESKQEPSAAQPAYPTAAGDLPMSMKGNQVNELILVTGATGYVGGRLVPRLLEEGRRVRVLVRDPGALEHKTWSSSVEIFYGDVLDAQSLEPAFDGVSQAYYLIHSMSEGGAFQQLDLQAASNFSVVAEQAGVQHLIYLGGLGDPSTELSDHLRSRQQVGKLLAEQGVPVTEFRAAVIIGSGSASFEMIRYITEGIPLIPCPTWVSGKVQPISIRNVLDYLAAALELEPSAGRVIEIGGADVMTYPEVVKTYARVRDLRRWVIKVPFLPSWFCTRVIGALTPIPVRLIRSLIDGLRNDVVLQDESAGKLFPQIRPMLVEESIRWALAALQAGSVETTWRDAFKSKNRKGRYDGSDTQQGIIMRRLERRFAANPSTVYEALTQFGAPAGWEFGHYSWHLHEWINQRWRKHSVKRRGRHKIRENDVVQDWRVVALKPGHRMELEAESMHFGDGWIELEVIEERPEQTLLRLSHYFAPHGSFGVLYWYLLAPWRTAALREAVDQITALLENTASSIELEIPAREPS